jgi:hypothetical protein
MCSDPQSLLAGRERLGMVGGRMKTRGILIRLTWGLVCAVLSVTTARAQDLEARRWTHLPVGTNVVGLGVAVGKGDLAFDPVLKVKDADVDTRQELASYVHMFGVLDRTARVDVLVPYQQSRWEGKLDGTRSSVRRNGFADPRIRVSINLMGAPALEGKQFKEFREAHPINTIVGAAVSVRLPWGDYKKDRLLNLGQNRYTIRPQLGVLHTRGPWSYELTGSVFFFTDNDKFFNGNKREQDPLYAIQAHAVRVFPDGWWVSAGTAYGWAGRSTVSGEKKDDRRGDFLSGASIGFPITPNQGMKFGYIRGRTQKDTGADTDTVVAGWTVRF